MLQPLPWAQLNPLALGVLQITGSVLGLPIALTRARPVKIMHTGTSLLLSDKWIHTQRPSL
jgi:hypothetical protein